MFLGLLNPFSKSVYPHQVRFFSKTQKSIIKMVQLALFFDICQKPWQDVGRMALKMDSATQKHTEWVVWSVGPIFFGVPVSGIHTQMFCWVTESTSGVRLPPPHHEFWKYSKNTPNVSATLKICKISLVGGPEHFLFFYDSIIFFFA